MLFCKVVSAANLEDASAASPAILADASADTSLSTLASKVSMLDCKLASAASLAAT